METKTLYAHVPAPAGVVVSFGGHPLSYSHTTVVNDESTVEVVVRAGIVVLLIDDEWYPLVREEWATQVPAQIEAARTTVQTAIDALTSPAPYFDTDPAAESEEALAERQTYLATLEADTCHAIYELALTDYRALREFLRSQSAERLGVLSYRFAAWLQVRRGITRTPGLLLRNWNALVSPDPWE